MINLQFFPSRQVALYMARLFLTRSFAVLFALVLVLMTLDLLELVRTGRNAAAPQTRNALRANFHFRLVEVVMMLLLPLLAVALAVPPKRSTSGLGIVLSIVMVVTYHKVNQYAEQMGALGRFDPAIALWVPLVLFAGLIVWMYWTLAHRPGGQPIGALERAFGRIGDRVARLFRRRRPPAAAPA